MQIHSFIIKSCIASYSLTLVCCNTKKTKEVGFSDEQGASVTDQVKEYHTTPSGLQYRIITEGVGPIPKITDKVKVHYVGKLGENGRIFDNSLERGEPAEFPVDAVIQGWQEGLQLMKVGSKYEFIIPPELGYGVRGAGGAIPANATLYFELRLLDIK